MKNLLLFVAILLLNLSQVNGQLVSELGVLDLAANGGMNPHTNASWADGDTYRLVFITDSVTTGSSTDTAFYNAIVRAVAAGSVTYPNLGNANWFAIVSTDGPNAANARENTQSEMGDTDGAFFLTDGTTEFADSIINFWMNRDDGEIDLDEDGNSWTTNTGTVGEFTAFGPVWTGTNADGTPDTRPLGNTGNDMARMGLAHPAATVGQWIDRDDSPKTDLKFLYAMSEVLTVRAQGACCFTDGSCTYGTAAACMAAGGLYQGDDVTCPTPQDYYADFDMDGYAAGPPTMFACDPGQNYKLLGELTGTEIDCNDGDPMLTFVGASCDDMDPVTGGDFIDENCTCVGGFIVPTIGQWGIILLSIIMMIIGIAVLKKRKVIFG